MIWILGEYAERIDNADELLGSFLEGFPDEDTQVRNETMADILIPILLYTGATAVIDCYCEVILKEAHRDTELSTVSTKLSHAG